MTAENRPPEAFRFERKYVIEHAGVAEVMLAVRCHPALFSETNPPRQVNNIYLDDHHWHHYRANVDGLAGRTKTRIRWYGALFAQVERPVLEWKIKRGQVGTKNRNTLEPFRVDSRVDRRVMPFLMQSSAIPPDRQADVVELRPQMMNAYHRRYFQSADGRFRVTIDHRLQFYRLDGFTPIQPLCPVVDGRVILELKYGTGLDPEARAVSNRFPWRISKSSKYVTGMDLLYGARFNPG